MTKIWEVLEKTPVVLAGTCYVIGLLVVTIYLNKYGVAVPINLFRVSYLFAGVWALIPLMFVWMWGMASDIDALVNNPSRPNILRDFFFPIIVGRDATSDDLLDVNGNLLRIIMLIFLVAFQILLLAGLYTAGVDFFHTEWIVIFLLSALCITIISMSFGLISATKKSGRLLIGIPISVFFSIIALINFAIYLAVFAIYTYQYIPSYLGGGKAIPVRLVVEPSVATQRQFRELGSIINSKTGVTDICRLLYITEDKYILLMGQGKNQRAVTISQDAIKGVLYQSQ